MDKERLLKRLSYHESMVDDTFVKSALHDAYEYIGGDGTKAVFKENGVISQWVCEECKEPLRIGYKFCPMCGKAVVWCKN